MTCPSKTRDGGNDQITTNFERRVGIITKAMLQGGGERLLASTFEYECDFFWHGQEGKTIKRKEKISSRHDVKLREINCGTSLGTSMQGGLEHVVSLDEGRGNINVRHAIQSVLEEQNSQKCTSAKTPRNP
jgi:hypothetical protein